jgi:hypothetical protein
MGSLGDALRSALRGAVARPLFSLLIVATVAVGIGANTAIFTVADATLRRGLPYPEPDRLYTLWETRDRADFGQSELAYPTFLDLRESQRSFQPWSTSSRWETAATPSATSSMVSRPRRARSSPRPTSAR